MTVKEVLITAATELGIAAEVRAYLDEGTADGQAAAENLLRCFNLVENEVALDYLPLCTEEEIVSQTGVIYYKELSREPVRILGVYDKWDNEAPFTLFPEYVKTQPNTLRVKYTYLPKEKTFTDESDFILYVSARLLALGVAAEYSLACGRFEEAAVWDKKYKDAIEAAYRAKPNKRLRSRRWV